MTAFSAPVSPQRSDLKSIYRGDTRPRHGEILSEKAAITRKRKASARKASTMRRATGAKAAATRRRRAAGAPARRPD
jgi:hypothetical protein